MNPLYAVTLCSAALIAVPAPATGQTIIINDSLSAHADRMVVKKGAQWTGRIARWSFGEYAVVSSKGGSTAVDTRRNLLNTATDSTSSQKFSFVMTNRTGDSAWVDAAHNVWVQALRGLALGHGFSLSGTDTVWQSDNFIAFITINRDTTDTWTLLMGLDQSETHTEYATILTNGERRLEVAFVSSDRKRRMPPPYGSALGYEFVENGRSVGAVQVFGGSFGVTYLVWLDRGLDARMKLILSAAMTAVLQSNSH
jgi:hypothetical protein